MAYSPLGLVQNRDLPVGVFPEPEEILVSSAGLARDGYEVELMRGTKDGGVDVVAVKDMGKAGLFKALWQAKKKGVKNKVGLSIVRELADTTREFKASKGIIVTSTYLTRDALARIQRDKYILGKVDRDDLNQWIHRVLFESDGTLPARALL